MSFTDVREAIRLLIKAQHPELNTYSSLTSPSDLPALYVVPSLDPSRYAVEYDVTMGDEAKYNIDILVLVGFTDLDSGFRKLDSLVSPLEAGSIPEIIRSDKTLGGTVDAVHLKGVKEYADKWSFCNIDHIGARIVTEVYESC